jgi:alpha-D-ribose 1-methylphosphonate 5-phosphate C-P lyase
MKWMGATNVPHPAPSERMSMTWELHLQCWDVGIHATVVGEEDLSRAIDRGGDDMIHRLRNQEDR